ncbi:MAG: tRNA glutamyl-Q(34) synthetase GluQRS [Moraxellaceae bacterium]|nr:tRNA glutamyl-Q(34) synthetase GluQRS [Moraxellaceae bacterium]
MANETSVIGRFAPSPTGPLHFGSLVAALGSYLDAHAQQGKWLLRIENLDPPREAPNATTSILACLEAHGLLWHEQVQYQSQHSDRYEHALATLSAAGHTYVCDCSRLAMQQASRPDCVSDCRLSKKAHGAIRLRTHTATVHYNDRLRGDISETLAATCGDFVLKRRDNFYAYQLAVVIDDAFSSVTDVVRGSDLLDNTARQCYLYDVLALPRPRYLHLPLATAENGQKLSKQNHAPAIQLNKASENLWDALCFLRHQPPASLQAAPVRELLEWAVAHWSPQLLPTQP